MGVTVAEERHSYTLYLGGHPTAPACARVALARNLRDWCLGELLDDAILVASELVTNAAKLCGPFTLTLIEDESAVIIAVTDGSQDEPTVLDGFEDSESEAGRGRAILDERKRKYSGDYRGA